MKNRFLIIPILMLLLTGISLSGTAFRSLRALGKENTESVMQLPTAQNTSAQAGAAVSENKYTGQVKLAWSLNGVFSDTLVTPTPSPAGTPAPPDLGSIDLALQLTQSDNLVTGYVTLDNTLVFTREHTITVAPGAAPIDIGPTVQGTFDGVNLTQSYPLSSSDPAVTDCRKHW